MKIRTCLAAALLMSATWAPAPGSAEPPDALRVTLWLKSRAKWDVEVLGRWGEDALRVSRVGERGEVSLPVADIARMDYAVPFDPLELREAYAREEFAGLVRDLGPAVGPSLAYLDVPSNVLPLLRLYLFCLYWAADYAQVLRVADLVRTQVAHETLVREAGLLKALALLELGRSEEAAEVLSPISAPSRHDEEGALYWYASARLHMARAAWREAQVEAAKIVAFAAKDFEWMPAGLYLSAVAYARRGAPAVARQVIAELRTAYPRSRWRRAADRLAEEIGEDEALPDGDQSKLSIERKRPLWALASLRRKSRVPLVTSYPTTCTLAGGLPCPT
jgi:hypothetical protein